MRGIGRCGSWRRIEVPLYLGEIPAAAAAGLVDYWPEKEIPISRERVRKPFMRRMGLGHLPESHAPQCQFDPSERLSPAW